MEDRFKLSRRGFISTSLSGLAVAGIAGFSPGAVFGQEQKNKTAGEVIYRTLGKTGLRMPIVGIDRKSVV